MFKHQIGRNMEVYIDDMILKSKLTCTHLVDLAKTFRVLKKFGIQLNPTKCTFGVNFSKFLDFIIHRLGINANPKKDRAIINMLPSCSAKEVQCLIGRLAALTRFLSRSGDKCQPFFRALRHPKDFWWTLECEEAFRKLKEHLARLPQLASTIPGEPLSLYLVAFKHIVSSVLV